jgi:PhoPQ-activated pathogenicity-related protein
VKKYDLVFLFIIVVAVAVAIPLEGCRATGGEDRVAEILPTSLASSPNELDAYIAQADPSFRYEVVQQQKAEGTSVTLIRMISQTWLTEAEVDRPVWEHYLYIYRPENVRHETGLMYISGGANDGKIPKISGDFLNLAKVTSSVVAEIRMVPNQPLVFKGDDYGPRSEDETLAYGWKKYLETRDPKWIFRLPMTKAVVRAIDTVTAFSATSEGGSLKVERFVVTGGSKRGWTTWTTAAVDKRVVAIIPIVIDLLNVERSFVYHYRKYGFWAPAIGDYFREGIMDRMGDPAFRELMAIEDPYAYRERMTMPKFLVNATGDQFFRPESSRFYYNDLPGEKRLRYVPNAGHNVSKGTDAMASIAAYYQAILEGVERPEIDWSVDPDGALRVTAKHLPRAVRLWAGNNPKFNDFRLDSAGPIFQAMELEPVASNTWIGKAPAPQSGYTAYFVELEWPGPGPYPFKFSTEVLVTPEVFSHGAPEPGKTRLGPERQ